MTSYQTSHRTAAHLARIPLCAAVSFLLCLFAVQAQASLVVSWTTNSTGALDTNDVRFVPLSNVQNADGSWNTKGVPIRLHNPTGYLTNWLTQNNWLYTNTVTGFWEILRVPDSSSNLVTAGSISLGANSNPFLILYNNASVTFATNAATATNALALSMVHGATIAGANGGGVTVNALGTINITNANQLQWNPNTPAFGSTYFPINFFNDGGFTAGDAFNQYGYPGIDLSITGTTLLDIWGATIGGNSTFSGTANISSGTIAGTLNATGGNVIATNQNPYLSKGQTVTPEQFGGIADGKKVSDVQYTNGSPYIYSPSGPFTAADVGKGIGLYLDVSNNLYMTSSIVAYMTPNTVKIGNNLTINWQTGITNGAGTNWGVINYGSDNTAAIQAACDALTNSGGTVKFSIGEYCCWGPLKSQGFYGTPCMVHQHSTPLSSTYIPFGGPKSFPVNLQGQGAILLQNVPSDSFGGTVIFVGTPATDSANTATAQASFYDVSSDYDGHSGNNYATTEVMFSDITFVVPFSSKITPIYAANSGSLIVQNCNFFPDPRPAAIISGTYWDDPVNYPLIVRNLPIPAGSAVANQYCQSAVVFPGTCNSCFCDAHNLNIVAFNNGIRFAENIIVDHVEFTACGSCAEYMTTCGGNAMLNTLHFTSSFYGIVVEGAGIHPIIARNCGCEIHPQNFPFVGFYDPNNELSGDWNYNMAQIMPVSFPPNLTVEAGDGSVYGNGAVESANQVMASGIGAPCAGSQLLWDMPWITNRIASPENTTPTIRCLNWAYADNYTLALGGNSCFMGTGSPPPFFTNGLDGPAVFINNNGAIWKANQVPQLTNYLTSAVTVDALYYSTNRTATTVLLTAEDNSVSYLSLNIYNQTNLAVTLNGTTACVASNMVVFDGNWHLAGFTYDGANCIIYFDGQPISTNAFSTTFTWQPAPSIPYLYGGYQKTGSLINNIACGENRLWAKCLTPSEMAKLYAMHFAGLGASTATGVYTPVYAHVTGTNVFFSTQH